MIQLATDPNASRLNWQPAAADGKEQAESKRARSGHAWPFLSRHGEQSTQADTQRTASPASGS